MQNLLAFMNALNGYFVALVGVVALLMFGLYIARMVRKQFAFDNERRLDQQRADAARAIVPVKSTSYD